MQINVYKQTLLKQKKQQKRSFTLSAKVASNIGRQTDAATWPVVYSCARHLTILSGAEVDEMRQ